MKKLWVIFCLALVTLGAASSEVDLLTRAASRDPGCKCQCSNTVFRDKYGKLNGNCKSADKGGQWCYVDPRYSQCNDLEKSQRFNQFWSYQACATPELSSSQCRSYIYGSSSNNGGVFSSSTTAFSSGGFSSGNSGGFSSGTGGGFNGGNSGGFPISSGQGYDSNQIDYGSSNFIFGSSGVTTGNPIGSNNVISNSQFNDNSNNNILNNDNQFNDNNQLNSDVVSSGSGLTLQQILNARFRSSGNLNSAVRFS